MKVQAKVPALRPDIRTFVRLAVRCLVRWPDPGARYRVYRGGAPRLVRP